MSIKERIVQSVDVSKLDQFRDFQRRLDAQEARLGFPPLRWYHSQYGSEDSYTLVCEREWDSLEAMASTYAKAQPEQERTKIMDEWITFGKSHRQEVWECLDDWMKQ
jgi:hypothetical protein